MLVRGSAALKSDCISAAFGDIRPLVHRAPSHEALATVEIQESEGKSANPDAYRRESQALGQSVVAAETLAGEEEEAAEDDDGDDSAAAGQQVRPTPELGSPRKRQAIAKTESSRAIPPKK